MRTLFSRVGVFLAGVQLRLSARLAAMGAYTGPAEAEEGVRQRLSALQARLTVMFREDPSRLQAERNFLFADRNLAAETERAACIAQDLDRASEAAPIASMSSELASAQVAAALGHSRARVAHRRSQDAVDRSRRLRYEAEVAMEDAQRATLNRLLVTAQEGLQTVNAFVAAFNRVRVRQRRPRLEPLREGTDQLLVAAAVAPFNPEMRTQL